MNFIGSPVIWALKYFPNFANLMVVVASGLRAESSVIIHALLQPQFRLHR